MICRLAPTYLKTIKVYGSFCIIMVNYTTLYRHHLMYLYHKLKYTVHTNLVFHLFLSYFTNFMFVFKSVAWAVLAYCLSQHNACLSFNSPKSISRAKWPQNFRETKPNKVRVVITNARERYIFIIIQWTSHLILRSRLVCLQYKIINKIVISTNFLSD